MAGRRRLAIAVVSCLWAHPAAAQNAGSPVAEANANLRPAGVMTGGTLAVTLELRMARWYPDDDGGTSLLVPAFAEAGRTPQVPAPLLRMPEGTRVRVTLRNELQVRATVFGLHRRPADTAEGIELEPGAVREVSFEAGAPGTYHYYAIADSAVRKMTDGPNGRWWHDGALSGAFIVDDAAAPPAADRVMVINILNLRATPLWPEHEILTINGKAWPHTERITARQGEPVRWRVVNSTPSEHPMHLHGAYFTVLGTGSAERYAWYAAEERRTVVTEYMLPEGTFDMEWTPLEPGGWLFHCHYMLHMSADLVLPRLVTAGGHDHRPDTPQAAPDVPRTHGMGGLVLAIDVQPRAGDAAPAPRGRARQVELVLEPREGEPGTVVTSIRDVGSGATSSSSPGPLLILRRDEPVDIRVINHMPQATAIHWHGLELESYHDGVPGIGRQSGQVTPAIPPGGEFVARMTPPRAGTFIYHTHWEHEQLAHGLYGPLIVLAPGATFDAEHDRVFVVAAGEVPWTTREVLLNGSRSPPPLDLQRGRTYRFRLINISPNLDITASFGLGEQDLEWRAVAKDGFELPAAQRRMVPSRLVFSVGETYDFEFTAGRAGTYQLRFRSNFSSDPAAEAVAEVRVR
jgi:manganese oxidase